MAYPNLTKTELVTLVEQRDAELANIAAENSSLKSDPTTVTVLDLKIESTQNRITAAQQRKKKISAQPLSESEKAVLKADIQRGIETLKLEQTELETLRTKLTPV